MSHKLVKIKPTNLSTFPEQNPNPVMESDLKGNILYMNNAANKTFPDLKDLSGDCKHPVVNAICSIEDPDQLEQEVLVKEISYKEHVFEMHIYKEEGSNRFRIYINDATLRKKAEREVAAKEWQYRTLLEGMNEGLLRCNMEGEVDFVNKRFCEMTGYFENELLGKSAHEVLLSGQWKKKMKQKIKKRKEGIFEEYEMPVTKKNGEKIWLYVYATPIINQSGKVIGSMEAHVDITEEKKLKNELKVKEYFYRTLIENSTDIVTILDENGIIKYESPSVERILGYEPDELIGKNCFDYFHPDDIPYLQQKLAYSLLNPEKLMTIEYRFRHKNGKWRVLESTGANLLDDKMISGIVNNSRDITDRKEAETTIYNKNKELQTFVYKASHDLKGPLASVKGLVNVAQDYLKDSEAMYYLTLISKSTERLDLTLMDLLEITTIHQGKVKAEKIDFKEMLIDVKDSLQNMPEFKMVKMKVFAEVKSDFYNDPQLIYSILQNLISNAVKYRKENIEDPQIEVIIKENPKGVVIEVIDNGIGIDKEVQDKIFDMFYRGTDQNKGTGLGLYIIKTTVDKLKGSIELESKEKEGSVFRIYLPDQRNFPENEQNNPTIEDQHN